ncbi:histone deacetylase [Coemansia aciculifera]|uniref:Histone deacetylase n=1 Tax=Coemansia aciculifera TaxID=417176 RepID=A0ACC1M3S8_9FUNG|nr:histone deacetylase [Coemansia aciculifera]
MDNLNTREYLEKVMARIGEQLRAIPHAPSVLMQEVPRDWPEDSDAEADDEVMDLQPETKLTRRQRDARVVPHTEVYDSDTDDEEPAANQGFAAYRHTGTATRPAK